MSEAAGQFLGLVNDRGYSGFETLWPDLASQPTGPTMSQPIAAKSGILNIIDTTGFAVLATENAGQPHTSLIAVTSFAAGRQLIFATYRNTLKYHNLQQNRRVSLLINGCPARGAADQDGYVVSAVGRVQDIADSDLAAMRAAHLQKHPDLAAFLQSSDCVLLSLAVESYQVVRGIDDVSWWKIDAMYPA